MEQELKELLEKENNEFEYGQGILKSLLYYGSKENNFKLPTIEDFILSEVANGTIDHLTGNGGKIKYKDSSIDGSFSFVHPLWEYFRDEIKASKKKIDPRVKNAIIKMVHYRRIDPSGPDRPYPNTELYDYFKSPWGVGFCHVTMRSTFSLSYEVINDIENKFLPLLSEPERRDIEGIGKCLKKYIHEDLEYIKKQYHW